MPYLTRGWFLIASKPTKKYVQTPYPKACVFGALGYDGTITKITTNVNHKKYLAFVKRLHKHNPKLCVITDNANWHLAKRVMKHIKTTKIKLIRLLPYSPELNPIEQYWKNIKQWLGTKTWSTLHELKRELRNAFKRHFLIPKICNY